MTRVSFSLTIKYRNFLGEKKKSIMVLKDLLGFVVVVVLFFLRPHVLKR